MWVQFGDYSLRTTPSKKYSIILQSEEELIKPRGGYKGVRNYYRNELALKHQVVLILWSLKISLSRKEDVALSELCTGFLLLGYKLSQTWWHKTTHIISQLLVS